MAKEGDQTRWVGIRPTDPSEDIPTTTRKLAPAIADLQAIKAAYIKRGNATNADCTASFHINVDAVDPNELWVITNIAAVNQDSLCDIRLIKVAAGDTRAFGEFQGVEAKMLVNWDGFLVFEPTDIIRVLFKLGGAADDLDCYVHGYKIGVY